MLRCPHMMQFSTPSSLGLCKCQLRGHPHQGHLPPDLFPHFTFKFIEPTSMFSKHLKSLWQAPPSNHIIVIFHPVLPPPASNFPLCITRNSIKPWSVGWAHHLQTSTTHQFHTLENEHPTEHHWWRRLYHHLYPVSGLRLPPPFLSLELWGFR